MKKISLFAILPAILCCSFIWFNQYDKQTAESKIKWYTFAEAVEANKKVPKKFFIDVYTDWCGWCKVMDRETFNDDKIAKYMNEHFYPVKLNSEKELDLTLNGYKFKWIETQPGRGVNELAYSLLDGKLSYPTVVILSEKLERIMLAPGYKDPKQMMPQLKFVAEEAYKTQTWEQYQNAYGN